MRMRFTLANPYALRHTNGAPAKPFCTYRRCKDKEPVRSVRFGVVCLVLLLPALSRAQQEPEELLPAGTQLYLRWDGVEAHRKAYSQTALGKMLQGDTGRFL